MLNTVGRDQSHRTRGLRPWRGRAISRAAGLALAVVLLQTSGSVGAGAIPKPEPRVIETIGGMVMSGPATGLGMMGPLLASGGKIYVSRYGGGIWAIDPAVSTATRVAGTNEYGYSGDGGPAVNAALAPDGAIGRDSSGRLYIADMVNHRIRRVDANGTISTIAGTGVEGNPTPGVARNSPLRWPTSLVTLADGTTYFFSTERIWRITPTGTLSAYAGNGSAGSSTGDGGPALNAQLGIVGQMVAAPNGDLFYVADSGVRIRRIATDGTITTVAGTGVSGTGPDGVAATTSAIAALSLTVGPDNTLYIGQFDRIRQVASGTISFVTGQAANTLTVDAQSRLYFLGQDNRIHRYAGGSLTTVAGNGAGQFSADGPDVSKAELSNIKSMTLLSNDNLIFAELGNGLLRKITPAGALTTLAGGGLQVPVDGMVGTHADMCPRGVGRDGFDTIYFVDPCSSSVWALGPNNQLQRVAGNGTSGSNSGDGGQATAAVLDAPHGLAVARDGTLYIDTMGMVRKVDPNGVITRFAGTGVPGFSGDGGLAKFAQIGYDAELAVDPQGDLYIADVDSDRVRRVKPTGVIDTYVGGGSGPTNGDGGPAKKAILDGPENIVVDGVGNLYIAERWGKRIRRVFRTDQTIETIAGSGGQGQGGDGGLATNATFDSPYGIALDPRGNVYIADGSVGHLRIVGGPEWRGSYVPLAPKRVLDTREGLGAPKRPLGQGGTINLKLLGVGGVPATNVSGVVLNVTATNGTASSYLTVWPTGGSRPGTSSLNFVASQTIPNSLAMGLGSGGKISIFNAFGSVDVVADVVGYYTERAAAPGARQITLPPSRILDTRKAVGVSIAAPVRANSTINVKVLGVGGVPLNTGVSAVILNVTATGGTKPSFVTAWPTGQTRPVASSLNFVANQTIPNQVIAKVGANGSISLYNRQGDVHLVADVVGYFTQAGDPVGSVVTLTQPKRILDTRTGLGSSARAKLGQGGVLQLKVAGAGGVPKSGVTAVAINLTATGATAASFITVWPTGSTRPVASSLNFVANETVPNQIIAKVGAGGTISLYNRYGAVDLVVDVVGYYT